MASIIDRTGYELDKIAKEWLIEMANGDARQAITMIENTSQLYDEITLETSEGNAAVKVSSIRQEGRGALQRHQRVHQVDACE